MAVQAEGSSNLIDNMNQDSPLFPASKTIADSIAVDVPRNFYMAKDYLQKYHGEWVKVTDSEIIQSSKQLASQYGLFVEPAAAAAYAGMCKQKINKQVQHNQEVVVLLTGSGLKDINSISSELVFPKALDPISFNSSHF